MQLVLSDMQKRISRSRENHDDAGREGLELHLAMTRFVEDGETAQRSRLEAVAQLEDWVGSNSITNLAVESHTGASDLAKIAAGKSGLSIATAKKIARATHPYRTSEATESLFDPIV